MQFGDKSTLHPDPGVAGSYRRPCVRHPVRLPVRPLGFLLISSHLISSLPQSSPRRAMNDYTRQEVGLRASQAMIDSRDAQRMRDWRRTEALRATRRGRGCRMCTKARRREAHAHTPQRRARRAHSSARGAQGRTPSSPSRLAPLMRLHSLPLVSAPNPHAAARGARGACRRCRWRRTRKCARKRVWMCTGSRRKDGKDRGVEMREEETGWESGADGADVCRCVRVLGGRESTHSTDCATPRSSAGSSAPLPSPPPLRHGATSHPCRC
ncbi:hypothetical protein B0H10DRAFT_2051904 [Mycena sp. CBHHK59/15]|nr:hypothetical protein B0H10DRAFT_2051904 [Mycena sp. CBHHK59/15]